MFSSCGPAQWRLNGPESFDEASNIVKSVPVTTLMKMMAFLIFSLLVLLVWKLLNHPILFVTVLFGFYLFKNYKHKVRNFYYSHHD